MLALGSFRLWLIADGEKLPGARNAFEFVVASVGEFDAGAGDEVDDRGRDEGLAGIGERGDSSGDVDADAGDVVADELDLSGVKATAQFDVECGKGNGEVARAADGAGGSVEDGERTVAGRLDDRASVPLDGLTTLAVVLFQ